MLMGYLLIFGFAALLASLGDTTKPIEKASVFHLKLSGPVSERSKENPINLLFSDQEVNQLGLDQIITAIENAKSDPKIEGILLEPGYLTTGLPTIAQIRRKLEEFKSSGKFIYAYSDHYSQGGYYLATVADSIFVNPVGAVDFRGLSANVTFFKEALDKMGVEMQIFKVGTFKSAVEPFIEKKMSDANRQQMTEYVNDIWSSVVADIANARKLTPESLQRFANEGIFAQEAEALVAIGMVDQLLYRQEVEERLQERCFDTKKEKLKLVKITDMAAATNKTPSKSKNQIALLYAAGEIDGSSDDRVDTKKLAAEIYKLKADSAVKAVILRVNSPGGSAFGSEQVWKALDDLKRDKPLVVSMGDLAASGGYYIAAGADWIVAEPTTLTGSIGIYGMIPNVKGLTDKLGISFDEVNTNRFSGMPSVTKPMSSEERQLIQSNVNRGYTLFTRRCAEGRNLPIDSLLNVAEGRIWSGKRALELGLVDELGGLEVALAKAISLAALSDYKIEEYPAKKEYMQSLIEDLSGTTQAIIGSRLLGESYKYYKQLNTIQQMEPVQARIPFMLTIE